MIPAVYYRGGSSKAVFFQEKDIPPPGPARDGLLKRLMGTPDPLQIDGMGGGRIINSKIAIIRPSDRDDADIDYTFAQVGITDDLVGYNANCGNISAAVGPFAITEGLVGRDKKGVSIVAGLNTREVRIFNTGTQKLLTSHVPVNEKTGKVVESGDFSIAGVPGTGAPILMDYSQTVGAGMGRGLLPTSNVVDKIEFGGREVAITICDVANLIAFVAGEDVGLTCAETAEEISADESMISNFREIRGKAAQLLGMCADWRAVDQESPLSPMVVAVSQTRGDGHLQARLVLDNRCHTSMAGTGAVCIAACSRIVGSVVSRMVRDGASNEAIFNIHHPAGIMPVSMKVKEPTRNTASPEFETLSFVRTARRIMTGHLHVPAGVSSGSSSLGHKTNGTAPEMNGNIKNDTSAGIRDQGVTEKLCDFVAQTTFDTIPPEVVAKLQELIIDHIGVAANAARNAESSDAFVKAFQIFAGNSGGSSTAYATGKNFSMPIAALLNGAFAHTFDFDDTMVEAILHPGASIIPAALAQAEAVSASGKTLLTALAVGYEVACRLGRALGTGSYSRGFHNTGTVGLFGAIAAIAKVKGLASAEINNAFGLAGSKAASSMQFLDNGSWNKRLHPGFAAYDAIMCVTLAETGIPGASRSIEGKSGFLHAYSDSPNPEGLTDSLGQEWVFCGTALKPFPACRMTHAAIEMTTRLASEHPGANSPEHISVRLCPASWNIVGRPLPNKVHPETIVDAQFSIYYQIALAWVYGDELGWAAYSPDKMNDERVRQICDRVEALSDPDVDVVEARMVFTGLGGGDKVLNMRYPLGEAQNPFSIEFIRRKFRSLAVPVYGATAAEKILLAIDGLVDNFVVDLMQHL